MWSTRFERLKALLVAAIAAKAGGSEAAREIAYVKERLQNNFLIPTNSNSMPLAPTDHDSFQVRSQGVARRPCGAH